jgi:prepilin-type N-terminal cleavage/methylation domain-containing protein
MPHPQTSPVRAGFSLMELIVAMAITSLIMIALIALIGQSSAVYRDSRSAVESLSDARSLMHFFESELSSRLPRTPLLSETSPDGPDKLGYIRAGSFDELVDTPRGDLSTSVYYVAFTADAPGSVSPKLFRHHLGPKETQELLEGPNPPPMPNVNPTADEPLLYNVLRFQAKPEQQTPGGVYIPWTPASSGSPDRIEIIIEITDDANAARLKSEDQWVKLRDSPKSQDLRSIRRFSRIIPLAP